MKRILKWVGIGTAVLVLGFFALVLFMPYDCVPHENTVRNEGATVRSAVLLFSVQEHRCPTSVRELQDAYLDKRRRTMDPWGTEYKILCGNAHENLDRITVVSAGKDGKFNTGDDILVPSPDE